MPGPPAKWRAQAWLPGTYPAPYGANDDVSSWSNHTCNYAYLGWNSIAQGINPQFTMVESGCFGHGAYVGDTWNDRASSVLP